MVNKSVASFEHTALILRVMRAWLFFLFLISSISMLGQEPASQDSLLPIVPYSSDGVARQWLNGSDKSSLPKFTAAPVPIQSIIIYFEKPGVDLSTTAQQQLNEIVEKLARNSKTGVLITGYSDRNGSSEKNWKESEKRAKSVRNFLVNSGIDSNRCVAKFVGDVGSIGKNPGDRKVIVEFIARP
jgi:outer membrane protein OmpA-like peptidoglycan-associated protein